MYNMHEQPKQQHITVKVYRTNECLMVAAPMAGLEPENILVEVTNDSRLTLHDNGRGLLKDVKENDAPLSTEALACVEWAISFATYQHTSSVQLEHVLLEYVRHQRLQPLLALVLTNAGSILPFSLIERSGQVYTTSLEILCVLWGRASKDMFTVWCYTTRGECISALRVERE